MPTAALTLKRVFDVRMTLRLARGAKAVETGPRSADTSPRTFTLSLFYGPNIAPRTGLKRVTQPRDPEG
jgi:hypothetical protein